MKNLTDYIKDPKTNNMYDAFGVTEERVNEILAALCPATEQALETKDVNQLYALDLMEENGFVLQNDQEAAFIFYTLFKVVQHLEGQNLIEMITSTLGNAVRVSVRDRIQKLDKEPTQGPVN